MAESTGEQCRECGAPLLPKRRFCVVCLAQIPGAARSPEGPLAEIAREMPSTRRPDKTLVFVPELRAARLKREGRTRRLLVAVTASCVALAITAFAVWRVQQRQQMLSDQQRREIMARRELDLYAKALQDFHADFGRYPTAKENLAALVRQPNTLAGWRGPYIEGDYSVDPWGNDYVYQVTNNGTKYELFTYGPEGETGKQIFLQVSSESHDGGAVPKL